MRSGRAVPRAELAENGPISSQKEQDLHEKNKISCKILIKFTLDKENS